MTLLTFINLLSNIIIFSSVFMFIISVFGRSNHPIWETKWKAYLAKIGLCISGCGALLNVINLSTPILSEIVLNVGLSLNFLWISAWQFHETKKNKNVNNKITQRLSEITTIKPVPLIIKEVVPVKEVTLVKENVQTKVVPQVQKDSSVKEQTSDKPKNSDPSATIKKQRKPKPLK